MEPSGWTTGVGYGLDVNGFQVGRDGNIYCSIKPGYIYRTSTITPTAPEYLFNKPRIAYVSLTQCDDDYAGSGTYASAVSGTSTLWSGDFSADIKIGDPIIVVSDVAVIGGAQSLAKLTPISSTSEESMVLRFDTTLSAGTTIALPFRGTSPTPSVTVYWGDGTQTTHNTFTDCSHTYDEEGEYLVQVVGTIERFGQTSYIWPGCEKLVSVQTFGNLGTTKIYELARNADDLTSLPYTLPTTVTDLRNLMPNTSINPPTISGWDVSNVTMMSGTFYNAAGFDQDITAWDVNGVTKFDKFLMGASSFNHSLGGWQLNEVGLTSIIEMFYDAGLSSENYSKTIIEWANYVYYNMDMSIGGPSGVSATGQNGMLYTDIAYDEYSAETFDNAIDARDFLNDTYPSGAGWTLTGDALDTSMVIEVSTYLSSGYYITLQPRGTVDVSIDWGDGESTAHSSATDVSHDYGSSGEYIVSITGEMTQFGDGTGPFDYHENISEIRTFGNLGTTTIPSIFAGYAMSNVTKFPIFLPSGLTDISGLFAGPNTIQFDLTDLRTSGVTNMSALFSGAIFDQDISTWDVSNVEDMSYMFYNAYTFDQDLGSWQLRLSGVDMSHMFDIDELGSGMSPDNYNRTLIGWANYVYENSGALSGVTLGASGLWWGDVEYTDISGQFNNAVDAREYLVDTCSWTINGDTEAMVLVFDTSKEAGTTVELPLRGAIDATVYWGDDTSDSYVEANSTTHKAHTWAAEGTYTVMITGSVYRYGYFADNGNISYVGVLKLLESRSFGNLGLYSIAGAYCKADNITYIPKALPSSVKTYDRLLTNAKIADASCIENIELWDTQYITDDNNGNAFYAVGAAPIDIDLSNFTILGQHYIAVGNMNPTFTTSTLRYSSMYALAAGNRAFTKQMPLSLSNIYELGHALYGCTAWNHSLADMQLRKAGVNMAEMLDYCGMSVENYSRTLIGWASYVYNSGAIDGPLSVSLGAVGRVYNDIHYEDYISGVFTNAADAATFLTTAIASGGAGWSITGGDPDGFIGGLQLQLDITDSGALVELPLYGTVDALVDWDDGSTYSEQIGSGDCAHTYDDSGTYYIRISGEVTQFGDGAPWSGVEYLTRVYNL